MSGSIAIKVRSLAAFCGLAVLLAGCSAVPSAGPTSDQIVANQDAVDGYIVVDIDDRVVAVLSRRPNHTLYGMFQEGRKPPDMRIGIGDSVTVTLWESGSSGLFSTASIDRTGAGSRTGVLPEQVVARDGTVQVPYAGRVRVANLTPAEAEALIVKSLKGKTAEPQAVVSITQNRNTTITVTGEVTNGMMVPIGLKGDRILDVVAAAGGIRAPAHESFVRLTREQKTASIPFNTLLADSRENIYVRAGDVLTVVRDPQRFTAFGGTGRNELIPFDAAGMTLEQAVARAGGLLDFRADASGVFLLRFEPASLVAVFSPEAIALPGHRAVRVVYRLNLRDAKSYFLARSFVMRDKDILYVANAPMTEVSKVLSTIGTLTAPAITGAAVYNAVR